MVNIKNFILYAIFQKVKGSFSIKFVYRTFNFVYKKYKIKFPKFFQSDVPLKISVNILTWYPNILSICLQLIDIVKGILYLQCDRLRKKYRKALKPVSILLNRKRTVALQVKPLLPKKKRYRREEKVVRQKKCNSNNKRLIITTKIIIVGGSNIILDNLQNIVSK